MKARAIATVALLGLLAGCAPSTSAASTATVTVGTRQFQVEVADTADEQRTGLSGRAEVPEGTGMLFTLAGRQERQVWMAGMQTRIDAAWIVDDQVLAVETLDPCTMTDQSMCPRWTSPGDVDALLEVPAGDSKVCRSERPSPSERTPHHDHDDRRRAARLGERHLPE